VLAAPQPLVYSRPVPSRRCDRCLGPALSGACDQPDLDNTLLSRITGLRTQAGGALVKTIGLETCHFMSVDTTMPQSTDNPDDQGASGNGESATNERNGSERDPNGPADSQSEAVLSDDSHERPKETSLSIEQRLAEIEATLSNLASKDWVSGCLDLAKLVRKDGENAVPGKDASDDKTKGEEKSVPEPKEKFMKPTSKANHISIEQYHARKFSRENPHNAIDVVWKQSKLPALEEQSESGSTIRQRGAERTDGGPTPPPHESDLPLLLQVNSLPLAELLYVIPPQATPPDASAVRRPVALLAPFKTLCFWENRLKSMIWSAEENSMVMALKTDPDAREHPDIFRETLEPQAVHESLAQEVVERPAESAEANAATERSGSEGNTTELNEGEVNPYSRQAFEDLQCLLAVYDKHIKPWWDYMRSPHADRVEFGDLCALFQPGDLLYEPDPQALVHRVYRIVQVTGARPKLRHLYNGSMAKNNSMAKYKRKPKPIDDEKPSNENGGPEKTNKQLDESGDWTSWGFYAYCIVFDGSTFKTVFACDWVKYYPGSKEVKSLKYWPLRLADEALRQRLLSDGKRYFELAPKGGLHYYEGRTLARGFFGPAISNPRPLERQPKAEDVESEIVVDFEGAFKENPDWAVDWTMTSYQEHDEAEDTMPTGIDTRLDDCAVFCNDVDDTQLMRWYITFDPWVPKSALPGEGSAGDSVREDVRLTMKRFRDTNDDTNDLLLLPYQIFGYVLRTGNWACFDIRTNRLRAVQEDNTSWNELQLPPGHKTTMISLVERHFRNREAGRQSLNFDFIEGKGKGLIVLLHGAPGVGKTSTAESLARKYNKPLLPVTCGHLGLDAREVEKSLAAKFQLAETWGCIVLLDEADVFLARRDKRDLQRNALVSVFLRTLEYYTGILILTTNRTGDFDEAFRSRIHIALYYDHLTTEMTEQIWRLNMQRLLRQKANVPHKTQSKEIESQTSVSTPPRETVTIEQDELENIVKFGQKHFEAYRLMRRSPWNGRQIRNAFQTAVALCEYEAHETERDSSDQRSKPDPLVPKLTWEAFKKVAVATNEFEVYLLETRGFSEEEMASMQALRAQNFGGRSFTAHGPSQTAAQVRLMADRSRQVIQDLDPGKDVILPPNFHGDEADDHDPWSTPAHLTRKLTMNSMQSSLNPRVYGSPQSQGGYVPPFDSGYNEYRQQPYDHRPSLGNPQPRQSYAGAPPAPNDGRGGYVYAQQPADYRDFRGHDAIYTHARSPGMGERPN
ncbi:P-loop containing nucleoside triphosphate hydrolase protein, partial [Teratosphaeria destructans]